MYNKKVLSTAKKELNKAKAPKKPDDIITDPMGQWNHPGLNTRIPGNGSKDINITMNGVYKPLLAIADTGERKKLYPGDNHTFRGAKYVDEFPEAKKGGERKRRKTKSLSGTNKLMLPNPLLRNYKNRVYDPNVDYFQDGGVSVGLNSFVDRDEEGNMIPMVIPSVNYSKGNFSTDISTNVPAEHPRDYEKNINLGVGYYKPLGKRGQYGNLGVQGDASISNDPYYNVGLEYTTPYDKRLGLNFKASTSSLKDLKNNLNTSVGLTYRFQDGGYLEAELTEDEIEEYRKGGYIVEDISVPELNQAQKGVIQISDPKEYAYRKKAYDDSLSMYNEAEENLKIRTALENKYNVTGHGRKEFTDPKILKIYGKQKGIAPTKVITMGGAEKVKNKNLYRIHNEGSFDGNLKYSSPIPETDFSRLQKLDFIYQKPKQQVEYKTSKYPNGYQPYSLYGKILDPERYGYGESNEGKPIQLGQQMEAFGKELQMEKYKKSGKYPWVKQDGGHIKTHKSKDGTITNTITKANGDVVIQVKTKDGKYYEKVKHGLPQFMKDEFKKRAEWENRSSGAAQPVDEFWTLPMGMTSSGVKGAVGLAKGLTSLGRNAVKSSLAQATKQGFNQSLIKSLPGSNLKNLLNSAFITFGINNYIDQNSDVRRATKKAYDDPTFDNVGEAIGENVWNALNFSGLNVGKGVKQLGKYATTLSGKLSKTKANSIPKRATSIGLNTYSGDSFTPIRIGGKNYKHAGQEWYNVDPGDYPGMTWEETQKQGLQDASESLNYLFKKNPNYSKKTFDNVGDFNYKPFSEGDAAIKDLYSKLNKQKTIGKNDFYTDEEVLDLANKYKQHLENWQNFEKDNPVDMSKELLRALLGAPDERAELFANLYPNSSIPNFRNKFLTPRQEELLKQYNFNIGSKGDLEKNSLKTFGDMFNKQQTDISPSFIEDLKKFDDPEDFINSANAKDVISEFRGSLGLSFDDIEKLSNEQLEKYRTIINNRLKQQTIDRINNQLLKNKFTGGKAWQEIIKNPGYYNRDGGLVKAQEGIISTKSHTDKKGNKTIVVTKDDGTKYIKVINKDGKVYNKIEPGMLPFMREHFKKQADWENRSSGMATPVDDFWTLPIGMTSAGVKGAVGLTKGLISLGRNAIKSPLVQATKAAFNTAPSWLPGASLSNAIASYFAGAGANEYIDQNSDVRRATKKAYDDPTAVNVTDAVGENLLNLLNFSGLNVRNQVNKGVKQLGKYAKIKTPLKEVPKQLPGSPNAVNDVQKAGFLNPFAIADRIIPRLPTPLNYVGVESSWNNVSPLNLIPGYGKKLFNKTDKLPVGFRKFGNSLEDVKTSKTLSPKGGSRMGAKQIESEGNWAEPNEVNEAYNGVFEATMNPNIEGSNIKLEKWNKRNGIVGTTKEGDVAIPITDPGLSFNRRLPFSNKYVSIDKQKLIDGKFQLATQLPHVQSLIEKYGLIAGHAIVLGYMTGGKKGAMENLKTVNKYSVDPVIDWSKKQWDSFDKTLNKKKQGGAINDAVYTDLTETEIQDYIKQGYIVEDVD